MRIRSPSKASGIESGSSLSEVWVLDVPVTPAAPRKGAAPSTATVKHLFDVVGATTGLVLLSPLMLLIALLIRLSSKGPALCHELRQGYQGHPFWLLKFRTMTIDPEAWLADLESRNGLTGNARFKRSDDPRITAVGRWLRHLHLDELPQLLHVLLGEMSLVGPMPLPMRDDAVLKQSQPDAYHRRLTALPGLTGAWQVERRGATDFQAMLQLDLEYIDRWSLRRDLAIVARSAWGALHGWGAS